MQAASNGSSAARVGGDSTGSPLLSRLFHNKNEKKKNKGTRGGTRLVGKDESGASSSSMMSEAANAPAAAAKSGGSSSFACFPLLLRREARGGASALSPKQRRPPPPTPPFDDQAFAPPAEASVSIRPGFAWSAATAAAALRAAERCERAPSLPQQPDKDTPDCQDEIVLVKNFGGDERATLAGVFDGHGKLGRAASTRAARAFAKALEADAARVLGQDRAARSSAMSDAIAAAHRELVGNDEAEENKLSSASACSASSSPQKHPYDLSGTTACVALQFAGRGLLLANVGDSRAVSGTVCNSAGTEGGGLAAVRLTKDHTPTSRWRGRGSPGQGLPCDRTGTPVVRLSGPTGSTEGLRRTPRRRSRDWR